MGFTGSGLHAQMRPPSHPLAKRDPALARNPLRPLCGGRIGASQRHTLNVPLHTTALAQAAAATLAATAVITAAFAFTTLATTASAPLVTSALIPPPPSFTAI